MKLNPVILSVYEMQIVCMSLNIIDIFLDDKWADYVRAEMGLDKRSNDE